MKGLLLAALLLMTQASFAQGKIEVVVKNIQENKGTVRVALFNNDKDFLKKPLEGKSMKVTGNELRFVFDNLKPGDYAVSILHDENDNGEMDSNLVGMPKEGFAFGNNAMGTFGPPAFKDAKVTVSDQPVVQIIKMKYL